MIYLITGVPGSGKTLYVVSTLLKTLMKDVVTDGAKVSRRLVVDGIPDLGIDHEMMDGSVVDDKGALSCPGFGLANWPDWVRPGDVVLVDEVQRYWRPRTMGAKVPPSIQSLETHRHLGIDVVLITQSPMLIDQNVRRLVGRHIHVRRLFGGSRAVLYDWDGCSADVHRTKGATSSYWSYPKDAFALYKSSELHTKQRLKIPPWVVLPVLAVIAGAFLVPRAAQVLTGAASGRTVVPAVPAAASGGVPAILGIGVPAIVPTAVVAPPSPDLRVVGTAAVGGRDVVVVVGEDGRFRLRSAVEFTGSGLGLAGVLDGHVITPVSGGLSKGQK